ncbi:TPA: hypothetical protein ACH3X1_008389 [Trebouxia sp. C0004]
MAEFAEDFGGSVSKAAGGQRLCHEDGCRLPGQGCGRLQSGETNREGYNHAGAAAAAAEQEGLDAGEGAPADEADVESKPNALESAIWRLTAGKGDGAVGLLLRPGQWRSALRCKSRGASV